MVELASLQAVSYIMGSLGVFVAALYYILNIQNNRRNQELSLKAQHQTLETLINEEALLFAKYLRGECESWAPRVTCLE